MSNQFPPISIPTATNVFAPKFSTPISYTKNDTVVDAVNNAVDFILNKDNLDEVNNQTTLTNNGTSDVNDSPFDTVQNTVENNAQNVTNEVNDVESNDFTDEYLSTLHTEITSEILLTYNRTINKLIPNKEEMINFLTILNTFNNGYVYLNAKQLLTVLLNKMKSDLGDKHSFCTRDMAEKIWISAGMTPFRKRDRKVKVEAPTLDLSCFEL